MTPILLKYRPKMFLHVSILLFSMAILGGCCKKDDDVDVEAVPTTLSLSKNQLQLELGNSEILTIASDIGDMIASWKSSDPLVASINESGMVTAVGFGTAKITATAEDMTAACDVEVALSELKLDQTELSLSVGDKEVLTITTEIGDAAIIWESSDPVIATVNNGTVKTYKRGTVTINATVAGATASCEVTVAYVLI